MENKDKKTLNFLDAGTTWSKILTVEDNLDGAFGAKNVSDGAKKEYRIIKTSDLKNLDLEFDLGTGHSAGFNYVKKYENEVVSLARGASRWLFEDNIVLDLGSRDVKWVKFKSGKFFDMDWNTNCASATGATIEMLLKFYNVDTKDLVPSDEKYPVTCGIFGLEKIMDDVSKGAEPKEAISKFIAGIAFNAWNFTKNPDRLCVSGGFCENKCFMDSIKKYCEVIPLGRYILVDGLYEEYKGSK